VPGLVLAALIYVLARTDLLQNWTSTAFGWDMILIPWLTGLFFLAVWIALVILGVRSAVITGTVAGIATLYFFIANGTFVRGFDALPRLLLLGGLACIPFIGARRELRKGTYDPPRKYIPTLDGWRAVAILIVVVDHVNFGQHSANRWYTTYAFQGQHGVEVFFVLSGFLITTLLLDERRNTGSIDLRSFYYRRIFRILPAAYAFLAVVSILSQFRVVTLSWFSLAGSVLFVGNYIFAPEVLNHFWSLGVEEQFYMMLPSMLVFLRKRTAVILAIFVCACVAGWRWYMIISPTYADPLQDFRLRFHTDFRLDTLLYGALLAGALRVEFIERWARRLLHPLVWLALLAWLVYDCRIPDGYTTVLRNLLITALIAGTVLRPLSLPGRILEVSVLRWIGRISYSLYLWQNLFCFVTYAPRGIFWLQRFPYNVIASFTAASLSYYFLERPIISWARRTRTPVATPKPVVDVAAPLAEPATGS